jgi:hypothetical protein
MTDTAPDVSAYLRERYAAMRPEERFLLGIRMFDTARAIVEASISADLSSLERRRAICRRFYPSLAEQVFPAQRYI